MRSAPWTFAAIAVAPVGAMSSDPPTTPWITAVPGSVTNVTSSPRFFQAPMSNATHWGMNPPMREYDTTMDVFSSGPLTLVAAVESGALATPGATLAAAAGLGDASGLGDAAGDEAGEGAGAA